jgi:4a-hydroxytetrahydrobiopterin dehydratase
MAYVSKVAALAEEANHHPDILVHGWNTVRLTLTTHSEGGLTDNDFQMARRIDEIQPLPFGPSP